MALANLAFSQVVLREPAEETAALLARLCRQAGKSATWWLCRDAGIADHEGALERTAEKLHLRATDTHVVASDDVVALLRAAAGPGGAAGGASLEIVSVRPVLGASLRVAYRAFTRQHDEQTRALVHDLPPALRLEDEEHEVRTDAAARGVEAYAPAHDYEARGSARIVGRVDLVLAKRRQLADCELIKLDKVELELGPAS